ncbi:MAG TPA: flagellar FliJ family protein [Opitutaceae bacterium]|nr:flagellar FliJ family protein [Opitutaceae bacterium]
MKRFRFPLRPVATVRAHQRLKARELFAAAVHQYVQAEERLAAARARVAELEGVLFTGRTGTFLAADAAALLRVYRGECAAAMAAERETIEAREAMQARRRDYLEADRRLQVVNRLEDRARATHRADLLRAEQAELDELAGFRATRIPALS